MHKATAAKLEGHSLSTIESNMNGTANGDIPHPEVVVSSDRSKGLGMEAEKIGGCEDLGWRGLLLRLRFR